MWCLCSWRLYRGPWDMQKISGHQAVVLNKTGRSFIPLVSEAKNLPPSELSLMASELMQASLGRGNVSFPLSFSLPTPPPPCRPVAPALSLPRGWPAASPCPSLRTPWFCTRWVGVCVEVAVGFRGRSRCLERTLPENLGPEEISCSILHAAPVLTSQTLRDTVKLQFPWLVFIFLCVNQQ